MNRRLVFVVLLPLATAACVTSSQVQERTLPLDRLLKEHDEAMYACAPTELAQARAAIAFARHEAAQGRPLGATRHVEEAERHSKAAFMGSRDPWCMADRDGDGIPDAMDQCPDEPEDFDGFQDDDGCPDPDNDGDGVPDDTDECPLTPGPAANRGCPILDADGDGVNDDVDDCPDRPGPRANRGCPWPDNDGDGIIDPQDRCPKEAGPLENDGCPYRLIEVTETRIVLRQTVFFRTARATIKPESLPLLNEVAQAMTDHPALRVRIEGHTDSVGSERTNLKLSQARADAVLRYLVRRGVSAGRLIAVGYGEDQPLDDNSTAAGRAVNRRVEFHILSK